jgi:ribosome biogenesis GTPase A
MQEIHNLVSNTIGTTREPIELPFNNHLIIDYPGFYLAGNIQNHLANKDLKKVLSRKEIKVVNYRLGEHQMISIDNIVTFIVDSDIRTPYQFTFSNDIKIERKNSAHFVLKDDHEIIDINQLPKFKRQDIIISGLGIITLTKSDAKLSISIPKGTKVDLVESLYN